MTYSGLLFIGPLATNIREVMTKMHNVFHTRIWMWKFVPSKILAIISTPKCVKDRAHLSTFKILIFEKFSCFIVLVVFLVFVQSSALVYVWFCEKMTFFPIFFSYHILAIYVDGASLGLPTACRLIAVSGTRLPSVDGLGRQVYKNAPPC